MQFYAQKIQKTVEVESEDDEGTITKKPSYVDLPQTQKEKKEIIFEAKLI